MAHDSWLYGDPERVLIRKQEEEARRHKSCGQCVHRAEIPLEHKTVVFCSKKYQTYGFRCHLFRLEQPIKRSILRLTENTKGKHGNK